MGPWDALTEEDRDALVGYVTAYGNIMVGNNCTRLPTILSTWDSNKRFLFENVFDGKLRIKIPVVTETQKDETIERLKTIYRVPYISSTRRGLSVYLMIHDEDKEGNAFVYDVLSYIERLTTRIPDLAPLTNTDCIYMSEAFLSMIKYSNVMSNQISQKIEYSYPIFGKGHVHKAVVQNGSKTVKAIRTFLVNIGYANMELFDSWRERVSAATTVQERKTNLVLSIHPIDFMTMSDNDCNWRSCMHWSGGEYSNGTIEMMNSKNVVIGYVESSEKAMMVRGGHGIPNKNWRCLFYITDKIVLSGKPYPYMNVDLCKKGVEFLREKAQKAFGMQFGGILSYTDMTWYYDHYDGCDMGSSYTITNLQEDDSEWSFCFDPDDYDEEDDMDYDTFVADQFDGKVIIGTGEFMYNDLYEDCSNQYFCAKPIGLNGLHGIDVSGPCTCMCCGNNMYPDDVDDVSDKYCLSCRDKYMCDDGMLRPDEDIYEIELDDGDTIRMTSSMMQQDLWWRPYTSSFTRKDVETSSTTCCIVAGDVDLDDLRDSTDYVLEDFLDTNGIEYMFVSIEAARAIDRESESFFKIRRHRSRYVYYADDMGKIRDELKAYNVVEEVDLDDEEQSSRAVLV